jgi:hypothetical protein
MNYIGSAAVPWTSGETHLINPIHSAITQRSEFHRHKRTVHVSHVKTETESVTESHDIIELA